MTPRESTVAAIERAGVVAVIMLQDSRTLRKAVDALTDGGITSIEITMTVPDAPLGSGSSHMRSETR